MRRRRPSDAGSRKRTWGPVSWRRAATHRAPSHLLVACASSMAPDGSRRRGDLRDARRAPSMARRRQIRRAGPASVSRERDDASPERACECRASDGADACDVLDAQRRSAPSSRAAPRAPCGRLGDPVVAAPALSRFLNPPSANPAAVFQAIERRVERRERERRRRPIASRSAGRARSREGPVRRRARG